MLNEEDTVSGGYSSGSGALTIGSISGTANFHDGSIDDVRIYNRALTQAEIQADMNTAVGGASNTAPTISSIAGQTTNEGTPTGAIAFTVGDAETRPEV